MNKNISRILWGLCILLFGVGMILYATGVIQNLLFDGWWTVFLIIPGIAMLFQRGCRTGGSVLVLLGVYFLLREQQVIHFRLSWPLILGIILVYIGIVLLFGWLFHPKARKDNTRSCFPFQNQNGSVDFNDFPSYQAVFAGVERNNASKGVERSQGERSVRFSENGFYGGPVKWRCSNRAARSIWRGANSSSSKRKAIGQCRSCIWFSRKPCGASGRPQPSAADS